MEGFLRPRPLAAAVAQYYCALAGVDSPDSEREDTTPGLKAPQIRRRRVGTA